MIAMRNTRRAMIGLGVATVVGLVGCGHSGAESAIHRHNDDGLRQMLDENPGLVNDRDGKGWTPLIYAARDGNLNAARMLLDHRADPNAAGNKGTTALMYAADNNRLTIAQLLIDHGANVNAVDAQGHTPLSFAQDGRYAAMADLLRQHGATGTR